MSTHRKNKASKFMVKGGPHRCSVCGKGFPYPHFRDLHQKLATSCSGEYTARAVATAAAAIKQHKSTQISDNNSEEELTAEFTGIDQPAAEEVEEKGGTSTDGNQSCDTNSISNNAHSENHDNSQAMNCVKRLFDAISIQKDRITATRHAQVNRYSVLFNDRKILMVDVDLLLMLIELYFLWPFGSFFILYYAIKIACRLWFSDGIIVNIFSNARIAINQEESQ
ncbi:unnamed protein product [Mucor circinelloides]